MENDSLDVLYHADCIDVLKSFPSETIDLIIADPPYYKTHGDFDFVWESKESYLQWVRQWASECCRVLRPTGAFYCWGSDKIIDSVSTCVLDTLNWSKRNLIVWDFQTGRPSKKAFRNETEFLWFYSKDEHRLNVDDIRIPYVNGGYETDKRKNPLGKSCGNVWINSRIAPNYPEWVDHPTQKPLAICDRIVRASSNKGDIVFVPFAGSGSEIISCINNGRHYIASEISKEYLDLCKERIEKVKQEKGDTYGERN